MAYRRNLTLIRGDTYPFYVSVLDNGEEVNITGASFKLTAKYNVEDSDSDKVFQITTSSGITITDAINGEILCVIPSSATSSLPAKEINLFYDIQMIDSSSNVYTIVLGKIKVLPDVTISTS